MQKLLLYFIALFILFFACTADQTDTDGKTTAPAITAGTPVAEDLLVPTPVPPPNVPGSNIKAVEQAPKEKLVYPKDFLDFGIPKFPEAKVTNNIMLDNSQGKYGQRISLSCSAPYDKILDFYTKALEKNGWTKNAKMDKTIQDEDVRFYTTNYKTENESHTLMLALTELGPENITVLQILKEN